MGSSPTASRSWTTRPRSWLAAPTRDRTSMPRGPERWKCPPRTRWGGSSREPRLLSGPDRPACRDGLLIHEAAGGVILAPAAPDLTSGVHLLIALVTCHHGTAWVHLFVGPILAPHGPAPAPRADEPKAVVMRNAKQHFEG